MLTLVRPQYGGGHVLPLQVLQRELYTTVSEKARSPMTQLHPTATHNLISDSHGTPRPRLQIDPLRFGHLPSLSLLRSCGGGGGGKGGESLSSCYLVLDTVLTHPKMVVGSIFVFCFRGRAVRLIK